MFEVIGIGAVGLIVLATVAFLGYSALVLPWWARTCLLEHRKSRGHWEERLDRNDTRLYNLERDVRDLKKQLSPDCTDTKVSS